MQEKPPFISYFDIFPNVWEGTLPYPPPAYFDFALRHAPVFVILEMHFSEKGQCSIFRMF